MKRIFRAPGLAAATLCNAQAAPTFFYGLDQVNAAAPRPNTAVARSQFLVAAGTTFLENFESQALGSGNRVLGFGGSPTTANLTLLGNFSNNFANGGNVITGRFLRTAVDSSTTNGCCSYFTLEFANAINAFAFDGNGLSNFGVNSNAALTKISIDGVGQFSAISQTTDLGYNFFGIVSDIPFTRLTLFRPFGSGLDEIDVDDFRFALAPGPTSACRT